MPLFFEKFYSRNLNKKYDIFLCFERLKNDIKKLYRRLLDGMAEHMVANPTQQKPTEQRNHSYPSPGGAAYYIFIIY